MTNQEAVTSNYSSYKCGRCGQGPTGMLGHYSMYCQVLHEMLSEHHFCCTDDCQRDNG